MAQVIRMHEVGGPDVLRVETVQVEAPGPGQVLIRQAAVGINYADTYFRNGTYPVPLPSGLGVEAAGVIEAVGPGVTHVQAGDRVSYTGFLNTLGAYCTERLLAADALIRLPDDIDMQTAAAISNRGLTAAYLLLRLHPFQPGDTLLLHAAAGGLGSLVAQWARHLGLVVIGTVSTEEKAQQAIANGCAHVINYCLEDVAARVHDITNGHGVDVVLDTVGKDTFMSSIKSLRRRGLMVCAGTSSGPVPPVDPQMLARHGSLFLTRPALADYIATPSEKAALLDALFTGLRTGWLRADIGQRYELAEATRAHHELEARRTTGASIFVVSGER
ncbi:MAG: quinone oxidoreductase [Hydrogenophaga sp.]|nr:quinone oxidoreductase [Hydrogenophaga sp.]